ncbi:MAG: hypothetical protein Q4B26_14090 [Eubacteriales bacterium]|nr:hypothetical protein [Eubacteriales bacterium]
MIETEEAEIREYMRRLRLCKTVEQVKTVYSDMLGELYKLKELHKDRIRAKEKKQK